jgi:hypothetical protein
MSDVMYVYLKTYHHLRSTISGVTFDRASPSDIINIRYASSRYLTQMGVSTAMASRTLDFIEELVKIPRGTSMEAAALVSSPDALMASCVLDGLRREHHGRAGQPPM